MAIIMSENSQRQLNNSTIKLVLTISLMLIVTITVSTFMFVQTDIATTKTLVSTFDRQTNFNHKLTMVNAPSERKPMNLTVTGPVTKQDYKDLQNNDMLSGKKGVKNNSAFKLLSTLNTSLSGDTDTDNNFKNKSSISWRKSLSSIVEDKSKNSNDRIGMMSDIELYEQIKRQRNHEKINHNYQWNAETDKLITQEDSFPSYHDSYDLTYNPDDYGYKKNDIYDIRSATLGSPEQTYSREIWSGSGKWDWPSYKPSIHPTISTNEYNNYHTQSKESPLTYWRRFSLIAFLKFSLINILTVGFIKLLFFLLIKLKIFMVAMFLKSLVVNKLKTLYKVLVVPILLLQLLPAFIQILMMLNTQSMSQIKLPTTTTTTRTIIPVTTRRTFTTSIRPFIIDNLDTADEIQ